MGLIQCLCQGTYSFSQWKWWTVPLCKNIFHVPRVEFCFFPPTYLSFYQKSTETFAGSSRLQGFLSQDSVDISTLQDIWWQPLPFFMPYFTEAKPLLQGHIGTRQAPACEENPAFLTHCPSATYLLSQEYKPLKNVRSCKCRRSRGPVSIFNPLKTLWGNCFGNQTSTTESQSRTVLLSVIMAH